MEFIFTDACADAPFARTLIINSDGPDEDIILHLAVDAPRSLKVALEYSLDRDAVRELRDMLSGWLGD